MGESTSHSKVHMPVKKRECDHEAGQPTWVRKIKRTRRLPQRTREMRFVSLHHHSTYSYLDGFQLPDAHARRAAEIGMGSIAMTEHGNVSSHVKLELACTKEKTSLGDPNPAYGVKPIFGVELYCGDIGENAKQRKNHLTVLAETQEGYSNLLRLVGRTYSDGFYYEPTASGPMLKEHSKGLVVLSGCQGSLLFTSLLGGKNIDPADAGYDRARKVAKNFKRSFGDRYYVEVQAFPGLDDTRRANPQLARIADELKIPLVATLDCHYTIPTEKEIQQVLHNVRGGGKQTLEEQARSWGYAADLCPPVNDREIIRKLIGTGLTRDQAVRAVLNSEEIGQRCNVSIPQLPQLRYPVSDGEDSHDIWRSWIREGWIYRGCDKLPPRERDEYKARLQREVGVIEEKDFIDYFLIVSDVVRWTKDSDILVGPARGSAAASLVCWLLRITEVNPMLFPNLVFERFIDITREDLPDIDLDFNSEERYRVVDYLANKYGRECVNNIGTFSTYKSKLALDDVARVYKIPSYEVGKVKDVLIERSSGDLRASATIEDTVEQFDQARNIFEAHPELGIAMELEGNVKGFGVHAAGIVISNGPVTDVCAVYERKVKDQVYNVLSLDKYDAEKKNLIKIDILGLNNATFLDMCRKQMGWSLDDLYNLPLDDKLTIDAFHRNDVVGIFQFDGRACRYVCGALQPDSFKEVCDITALARPGPLHNGAANEYIDVKRGERKPELLHPALTDITKDTYFQIVYQEQILRIVREIGNFSWTHASHIRRIISRKIGEQEFMRQWDTFWQGCQDLHPDLSLEVAKDIWGRCITAGSYAFNAAHSVAYGMLGWHSMWFKQHEPELYYQMALTYMTQKKHFDLMRDAVRGNGPRIGIELKPPHPKTAARSWQRERGAIVAGFVQIPGIADKTAQSIDLYREANGELETWDELQAVKGIGRKTIQKIYDFANDPDPHDVFKLDKAIAEVRRAIKMGELGQLPVPNVTSRDIPYTRGRDLPCVWLGTIQVRNVRDMFEFNRAKGKEMIQDEDGDWWLDDKKVERPDLNEWMVMVGDDEHDQMGIRVDRFKYPGYRSELWNMHLGHDLLLVEGYKPGFINTRQIWVNRMWVIDPYEDEEE